MADDDALLRRMEEDRGWLARLLANVPALGAYLAERRYRDADRLIRDEIARRLDGLQAGVNAAVGAAADDVRQSARLADLQRLQTRLGALANRVRAADPGHAGLSAAVKVRESDLAALLAHDRALLGALLDMHARLRDPAAAGQAAAALDDFERQFDERARRLRDLAAAPSGRA